MDIKHIELTEDEFDEKFNIIPGPDGGSYHEHLSDTKKYRPEQVWTAVDGDDDKHYLVSGVAFVNRFAYLVTEESVPEDEMYTVEWV